MNSLPFQRFIDLITYDQQVHVFEKELKALESDVSNLEQQRKTYAHDVEKAHASVVAAKKEVDAQELEMKALDTAEKEAQKKLDNAQTQKEYLALKKEVENLKKQQHEFEDTLIQTWNVLEHADREHQAKQRVYDEKSATFNTAIDEKVTKITQVRVQIDQMNKEREAKLVGVPAEWLEKYAMMRSRIPNPVVPVVNDSCSACFYRIPQQDLMALRRRKLLQCRDCYRFLYLPESQLEPEVETAEK